MKIRAKHVRVLGIEAWALHGRVEGVYVRLGKNKGARTREVLPEVFADFDRHGDVVGIEFSRPGDFNIDAMKQVSEAVHVPVLRALDVSRIPANTEMCLQMV